MNVGYRQHEMGRPILVLPDTLMDYENRLRNMDIDSKQTEPTVVKDINKISRSSSSYVANELGLTLKRDFDVSNFYAP